MLAVLCTELVHVLVAQGIDHLVHEVFSGGVDHPLASVGTDFVAHGMHQVRLAQSGATIDEQRIVFACRLFSDSTRCGVGKLVALANDKRVERLPCVHANDGSWQRCHLNHRLGCRSWWGGPVCGVEGDAHGSRQDSGDFPLHCL